jgi:hypothetical protein
MRCLSSGLPHLFRQWHDAGHTQSLLSLFPHDKLVPAVVLYSEGFGAPADLATTGAPVADSRAEAVELIDSLQHASW